METVNAIKFVDKLSQEGSTTLEVHTSQAIYFTEHMLKADSVASI